MREGGKGKERNERGRVGMTSVRACVSACVRLCNHKIPNYRRRMTSC